jgi:hypothetical protein
MGMLKVMMRAIGSIDIVGHAGSEHHIHPAAGICDSVVYLQLCGRMDWLLNWDWD